MISRILSRTPLLGLFTALALQAQVVVIVSAKNPITKLPPGELTQIFLGQTSTFFNGARVEPLDLPSASPLHEAFYQTFVGKTPAQMKAFWAKQSFTGKGDPPRTLPNPGEIVKLVASNPRYIAYVEPSVVNDSVKVLKIQ